MKRVITSLLILVAVAYAACAQTGLEINKIFGGRYVSDPSVSEVMVSGDQPFLRELELSRLATFKGDAAKYVPIIQPLVLADGKDAPGRDVRYRDGKLVYAYFALKPAVIDKRKMRQYLYYILNDKGDHPTVMLIYFAGNVHPSQASHIVESLK